MPSTPLLSVACRWPRKAVATATPRVLVALLLGLAGHAVLAQEVPLNDTGQITCFNATTATGVVSPATPEPEEPGFEGQDCSQGVAAADALGNQVKVGASTTPGRDYTKIANDGRVLPESAALGSGPPTGAARATTSAAWCGS